MNLGRVLAWTALLGAVGAGLGYGVAKFSTSIYEARGTVVLQSSGDPTDAKGAALTLFRSPALLKSVMDGVQASHPTLHSAKGISPTVALSPGDGGATLEVRATSTDPDQAAALANQAVLTYNQFASGANAATSQTELARLAQKTAHAKHKLGLVQHAIEDLEQRTGIMQVDGAIQRAADYQALLAQMRDSDASQLKSTRDELASEYRKLPSVPATTEGPTVEAPNPKVDAEIAKLQQLQAQRVDLLGTYLPTSTKVTAVDAQIQAQREILAAEKEKALKVQRRETGPNPLREELEKRIADHEAQVVSLQAAISEVGQAEERQKASVKGLPKDQAQMLDLQREQSLAEAAYKALRTQLDGISVQGSSNRLPLLTTVVEAPVPTTPFWPNFETMASVGGAIGLILGLIVGVLTQPTAPEYEPEYTSAPLGPSGPELPVRMTAPPLPSRRGDPLAALAAPSANPAEAYRFMVFSLQAKSDSAEHTVLFTGVTSDRLCSEAAAQFAIAMSQTGVRTLLADCNLRHQALTEAFGFKGKSGISDMLSRTLLPTPGSDLLLETAHQDLYFLPSGSEETEGLGSYPNLQVSGLVTDLMDKAMVKVINAPPCAVVSDAPRLVRFANHVCLVASKADRQRGLVAKAHEILKRAGATEIDILVIDKEESKESFLG